MPERTNPRTDAVAVIAGRYELLRELQGGEDIQLWEGFDAALERRVLVRFLRHDVAQNDAALQRFWKAARTSARGGGAVGERVLDGGSDPETGRAFLICELPPDVLDNGAPVTDRPTKALILPPDGATWSAPNRARAARLVIPALVLVMLGLGIAVVRPAIAGWLAWVNTPLGALSQNSVQRPAAVPAPVSSPAPPAAPAQKTLPPVPTKPPTTVATATTETSTGVPRRVVNTDGRGVALRDAPGGNRLPEKGYDEGATVTAFESSGQWTRIRVATGAKDGS